MLSHVADRITGDSGKGSQREDSTLEKEEEEEGGEKDGSGRNEDQKSRTNEMGQARGHR